jgi:hypothetical protein
MCCSRLKLALGQQNRLRRCAGFLFDPPCAGYPFNPPAFSANIDLRGGPTVMVLAVHVTD